MSDVQFSEPSPEHQAFMGEALTLSGQVASELIPGVGLDGSESDLETLQGVVDSGLLEGAADPLYVLRCLGVVFGNVLKSSLPGLAWASITEEYGCDLGLRYGETTIMLFPVTMLSKRAEDGREIELLPLHAGVVEHVRSMIASGDYQ